VSRTARRTAALTFAAAIAGGCATTLPETQYYTLRAPAASAPSVRADGLRIGVETFAVDPPYDQDRLVFRRGEEEAKVGFYAYHRWASSLGRLAAVAFAEGLAGSPGIAGVEPASSAGSYDARLAGRILYVEEITLPDAVEGRVGLALSLRGADGGVLWGRTLEARAAGNATSGEQVAALLQSAFERALTEARAALGQALAARSAVAPGDRQ